MNDDEIRRQFDDLRAGRIGPVNTVTLSTSGTTTTVTTRSCSSTSHVSLRPLDSGAATEVAAGKLFVTPANGSFVITHTVSGYPARSFSWAVFSPVNY